MNTTQLEWLTKKEAAVRLADHGIPRSILPKSIRLQETDDILQELSDPGLNADSAGRRWR
jgi:hypothetical protein